MIILCRPTSTNPSSDTIAPFMDCGPAITPVRPIQPPDATAPFMDCGPAITPVRPIQPPDTTAPFMDCGPDITPVRPIVPMDIPAAGTATAWFTGEDLIVGNAVANWPDRIGNNDLTESAAGLQPTAVAGTNGQTFASLSSDRLQLATPQSTKAAMVVVRNLANGSNPLLSSGEPTPEGSAELLIGGAYDVSVKGDGTGNWGGATIDGGENPEVATNGDIAVPGAGLSTTGTHIVFMHFHEPEDLEFLGQIGAAQGTFEIAEVLLWEKAPCYDEVQQNEGYFAIRYGLTLPAAHPFNGIDPEVTPNPPRNRVSNVAQLIAATTNGNPGDVVFVDSGTFTLLAPLEIQPMMQVIGVGNATIIDADPSWAPGFADVDPPTGPVVELYDAYLFKTQTDNGISGSTVLCDMFMTATQLHGAVHYANFHNYCTCRNLTIEDLGWCGARLQRTTGSYFDHCTFNTPSRKQKETGAAVLGNNVFDTHIAHCLTDVAPATSGAFVGFKSPQASGTLIEWTEFLHTGFSIEVPHTNNDFNNLIRNCIMFGASSLPKHSSGGGTVGANSFTRNPDGSLTISGGDYSWQFFNVRFETSYIIEGPRNSMIVGHSVIIDERAGVTGNALTCFNGTTANAGYVYRGPMIFYDNYMRPDRGVFNCTGTTGGAERITIINNLIEQIAGSAADGIFGNANSTTLNHASNLISSNIIDASGQAVDLFRNANSRNGTTVENNTLTNITDSGGFSNPNTGAPRGPIAPPNFLAGIDARWQINGWTKTPA